MTAFSAFLLDAVHDSLRHRCCVCLCSHEHVAFFQLQPVYGDDPAVLLPTVVRRCRCVCGCVQ
jgi:hypothetical protein